MTAENISQLLKKEFGEDVIIAEDFTGLQHSLTIKTDSINKVGIFLRNSPETYFDFLSCLTGIDYGVEKNQFGVVYHLMSISKQIQIVLKIVIENDRDTNFLPIVPSVANVWRTAEWHEREAYDLVGIAFSDHPDMRRILCPEDWEGYPLRKDYQEAEHYRGLKIKFEK